MDGSQFEFLRVFCPEGAVFVVVGSGACGGGIAIAIAVAVDDDGITSCTYVKHKTRYFMFWCCACAHNHFSFTRTPFPSCFPLTFDAALIPILCALFLVFVFSVT